MCLFWGDFCRPMLAAGSAWPHFWTQKDLEICEQNSCFLLPGCVEISCLQNFYVTGHMWQTANGSHITSLKNGLGVWFLEPQSCGCSFAFVHQFLLGLPYSLLLWSTCGLSVWCYSQLLCVNVQPEEPGRQCLGVAWKDDAMKTGVWSQIAWVPSGSVVSG